ncbi:fungal-specific transcription factor domain-containing protein [Ilyonectria sp. MPI-CAGE-AT-0026]|nr:fungal-specific transcription factor domain-containing protein [Ilyonectria sp. MPI-CAGE-AT-0026]
MEDLRRSNHHDPRTRWTCITCRRRKVKCDKANPCTNCRNANIECVTPPSGRSSAKSRKRTDHHLNLVGRIRRLEGALESFRQPNSHIGTSNNLCEGDEAALFQQRREGSPLSEENDQVDGTVLNCARRAGQLSLETENHSPSAGSTHNLSRLFINSGGSRFINTCMLDVLEQEVQSLKGTLEKNELHDSADDSLRSAPEGSASGFPLHFRPMSSVNGLFKPLLHPQSLPRMWSLFKHRVDPVVKVLHIPSLEPIITAAGASSQISEELGALVFAISYGAIASLSDEECMAEFGESHAILSSQYRSACEQACAHAEFLKSTKIITLQAYVIYLAALRRDESPKVVWSLAGLAMRVAQTMGLRSDGVHWGLSPFNIEMRRRLWWELCTLEAQISEEHGCAPAVVEAQFDTHMPLNVDDVDLHPDMAELPVPKIGITEMTISLIKFKLTDTLQHILRQWHNTATQQSPSDDDSAELTPEQKEVWINQSHQQIEQIYFSGLELSLPSTWVVTTVIRLHLSTMWLMVFPHTQRHDEGVVLPERIREKLFIASIESIEYGNLLDNDSRASQWRWYFGSYRQWHSVVFTLSELCRKTQGQLVDRAWDAVEVMVQTRFRNRKKKVQQLLLWPLVKRMLIKARMAREKTFLDDLLLKGVGPNGDLPVSIACYPAIDALLKSERSVKVMSPKAGASHPTTTLEYLEAQTTFDGAAEINPPQQMGGAVGLDGNWDTSAFNAGTSLLYAKEFVGVLGDDSVPDQIFLGSGARGTGPIMLTDGNSQYGWRDTNADDDGHILDDVF